MEPTTQENLFQVLTASILGLDPDSGVRVEWPTGGAPAWNIDENIAFIRVVEADDAYNRQRYDRDTDMSSPELLLTETSYTRVWRVDWTIHGPESFNNAKKLRSGMFIQDYKDVLAKSNIYLIPDIVAPQRVPELFSDQWWERTDIHMFFNELVTEDRTTPYVKSVEVITKTVKGTASDIIIE